MGLPEHFFQHALHFDEEFFYSVCSAMSWRWPVLGRWIGQAGIRLHPNSLRLQKNLFSLYLAPDSLDYVESVLQQNPALGLSGQFAALLEDCGQRGRAVTWWEKIQNSDDPAGHSLYVQSLLKNPSYSPEKLLTAMQTWASRHAAFPWQSMPFRKDYREDSPVRLGFCCSFFDSATMQNQFFPWLSEVIKQGHQIFLYGDSTWRNEHVTVRSGIRNLSDDAFVEMVRADQLDMIVETTGFSPGHRFSALARRCAPVQVSYLNHAGTSGVNNIDFVLTDEVCIAPGEEKYYTEKIQKMPHCFFCFNFEHEGHGFPGTLPYMQNGFWTLGFFGTGSKFNDRYIAMLSAVLHALPDSRLILANAGFGYSAWRSELTEKFSKAGIAKSRLTLLPKQSRSKIANLHQACDFTMDSYPYCGGNSLSESLWYGVPAASLLGERFAARYGASILHYSGLGDWIARDIDELVAVYIRQISAPEKLQELRFSLRQKLTRPGSYSDCHQFANDFITSCRQMIHRMQQSNTTR